MSGSQVRLSVQAADDRTVDLVLPAAPPVAELLPVLVDMVGVMPGPWHLQRLDGRRLDASISLRGNMIGDGDLLILGDEEPPPPPHRPPDPFALTAGRSRAPAPGAPPTRWAVGWSVALSAALLCTCGGSPVGAAVAALGCVGSIIALARCAESLRVVLCSTAIIFGATSGFLAVPSTPSAPNLLLAAAVAALVSWIVLRLNRRTALIGAAAACFCVPVALAAGIATVHPLPLHSLGAGLCAVAWTVLTLTPRLAVAAAGLTADTADPPRVAHTRQLLGGLVAGSAAAVVVGTTVMVVDHRHRAALLALGLLLSAGLLLRSHTPFHPALQTWLFACGLTCATVTFIASASAFPDHVPWLSLAALGSGPLMLRMGAPSSASARVTARLDLVMSVALVPIAWWITGVYAMVRGQ